MKKFLSLALALIMVLSMMPMAMAAGGDTTETKTCEHNNWAETPTEETKVTCTTDGRAVYACLELNCSGTKTVITKALGHDMKEQGTEAAGYKAPTCETAGVMPTKCDHEGCSQTGTVEIPALGHDFNSDGSCKRTGCTVKASEVYSVAMPSKELAMDAEAANLLMTVSVIEKATNQTASFDVTNWTSSNTEVATINSTSGALTLLAPGQSTINADVVVKGAKFSVSGTLTVKNEGTIECKGDLVEKFAKNNYIQLESTLSDKSVTNITWSYESNNKIISVDKNGKVTATAPGAATITITAKWGTPERTETTTVKVGFYDILNAEVIVKSGTTSFMFDDTNVFSAMTLGTTTLTSVKNQSLISAWSYDGPTYDALALSQTTGSASYGKITNTGSSLLYAYDASKINRFDVSREDDLMFTCLNKGTFELEYTLYSNGLMVRYGTIEIKVPDGSSDITYTTSYNKAITLNESDFYKFWNKSTNKSNLDYVVFNDVPTVGEMTVDNSKNAADVTTSMYFYYKYDSKTDNGAKDYDLDAVYYTPYSKATKSYEEVLSFTCYGETASETLSGVLTIKVGENVSFTDVKTSDYFYDAVVWAVNEGITNGVTSTTFCPDMSCDRAQVVTFLWRAAGEPTPTSSYMPFTDVDKNDYYYDAVLWAVQQGITEGTSKTTFSPRMTVTRGQVVTFLWRAMGEKSVSTVNPFNDIKTSDYFYDAVLWAVKNEITNGMSATTFLPEYGCTRGQIVTFLYRAYND